MVLLSQVKRGAATGGEQLHSATNPPKVHEVHLCADGTATKAVGIYAVTFPSTRIANHQLFIALVPKPLLAYRK